jgi:hypothetical protein
VQKTRCWTAVSIFKKLRGLLAKFWAKLQIVLHYYGPRVDLAKDEGLFRKRTGPKGYAQIRAVGSRSDGLGFKGAGSNRGRRFPIERLRATPATAAARIAGELFPAAARGE